MPRSAFRNSSISRFNSEFKHLSKSKLSQYNRALNCNENNVTMQKKQHSLMQDTVLILRGKDDLDMFFACFIIHPFEIKHKSSSSWSVMSRIAWCFPCYSFKTLPVIIPWAWTQISISLCKHSTLNPLVTFTGCELHNAVYEGLILDRLWCVGIVR